MRVFLQTRGRTLDYSFLGEAPDECWWSQYRNQTAFEDPTILVHSDSRRWRICLSGIESNRKDRVGTTIRYTLVLEGDCTNKKGSATARASVGSWLDDVVAKRPVSSIQAALDDEFPEAFVERVLSERSREAGADVGTKITVALARLAAWPTAHSANNETRSWIGSTAKKRAREAFMCRVQALLDGEAGRALLLNLIGTEDEARAVVEQGGPAAILIEDEAGALGDGTVGLEKKKTSPPRTPLQPRTQGWMWVADLAINLSVLAILLWLLLGSLPRKSDALRKSDAGSSDAGSST